MFGARYGDCAELWYSTKGIHAGARLELASGHEHHAASDTPDQRARQDHSQRLSSEGQHVNIARFGPGQGASRAGVRLVI